MTRRNRYHSFAQGAKKDLQKATMKELYRQAASIFAAAILLPLPSNGPTQSNPHPA